MPIIGIGQEICDNSIDDDNIQLVDINDPSCACEVVDYQSMIPNPSFESYNCCPTSPGQMNCLNDWSQASAGTSDYLNLCGWTTEDFYAPPFPIPDGDACVRILDGYLKNETDSYIHKEYAGVCLNRPLLKDSLYRFELYIGFRSELESPDFNFAFFGSDDCSNLPFSTGEEFGCPLRYTGFTLLASQLVKNDSGNLWKKVSIEITPEEDIYAVVIGPDCISGENRDWYAYFLDNLILLEKSGFDFRLLPSVSPCSPDFTFAVNDNPDLSYQWFKEGIALVGETGAQISMMQGEGRYQLRITDRGRCRISEDYIYSIPFITDTISQSLCEGEQFLFGDKLLTLSGMYIDTLPSIENCDSIVTLDLEVRKNTMDSIPIHILRGSSFIYNDISYNSAGEYPILFMNIDGCDSLVLLQLTVSDIYIPNIFSPNGDGINDVFELPRAMVDIAEINISIYDRWGTLIFEGSSWDGTGGGEIFNTGVYVYSIVLTTTLGERLRYTGDVTLIK